MTIARPRFRLFGYLRVVALLAVIAALGTLGLLRAAQARAGDVLVQVGQQLMRLPDARYGRGVRDLWLNGLSLKVQSGSSDHAPEWVVSQFRAACRAHAALQLDERERGELGALAQVGWFQSALDGVFVQKGEAGTAVACIDAMGKPLDVLSVAAAAQRFVESGELLELGRLRYALVRKGEQGSVFLNLWTEGSARLLEQFPPDRDAPGLDFPDVRRVAGSQRYLSARMSESLLVIYQHRDVSAEQLAGSYRAALAEGGYQILDRFVHSEGHYTYGFEKGVHHGVLTVTSRDGLAMATLLSQP